MGQTSLRLHACVFPICAHVGAPMMRVTLLAERGPKRGQCEKGPSCHLTCPPYTFIGMSSGLAGTVGEGMAAAAAAEAQDLQPGATAEVAMVAHLRPAMPV